MPLLALDSLNKQYGALVVANALTFSVGEGEIVGILGPNGAGKTTLFNMIAGSVRPSGGRIQFNDRDISDLGSSERCRLGISRSFQVPHPFNGMTVFENVLVGATFGRTPDDPETRALAVLEKTGMRPKANRMASTLGLLDRKRLEMARALATNPTLLLLDEIAGGLTDSECVSLVSAIRDIHSSGVTIIWIEHVVHALLAAATRLIVINFGKLFADGNPEEVIASREVKTIYLGGDAVV